MNTKKHNLAYLLDILLPCFLFFLCGCSTGIPKISGTAYFVDCSKGIDSNPGTSASQPWRSLEKVSGTEFAPGDGIFFKRGSVCAGSLQPHGSGQEGKPILLGAYGNGTRPVLSGGKLTDVLLLKNQSYWEIQGLELTGGTMYGLHITGVPGEGALKHFRLKDLVIHDLNGGDLTTKVSGLVVLASGGEDNTIDDVVIDHVTAYNTNQWGGIVVAGLSGDFKADPPRLSTNVTIRNSTVHHVYGDGIVLWGVQNGLIEKSLAYETGLQPPPKTIGTPSSIWTWMCHDCTVQYNESFAAHSPDVDGGAYDVDWGNVNNLYQYNYGHDTDSYCISVFGSGGLTTSNTIIRFNICSNNGLESSQATSSGAVFLYTWGGGTLDGVQIYNNTIYWNPQGNSNAIVNTAAFTGNKANFFKNNIVYSTAPWILFSNKNLSFDHNLYWYPGIQDTIWYYNEDAYKNFAEYKKETGQDVHSLFADPLLKDFTYHQVGKPANAFTLLKGSPAINAGMDVGAMGPHDFYGVPLRANGSYDIGAVEWQGK